MSFGKRFEKEVYQVLETIEEHFELDIHIIKNEGSTHNVNLPDFDLTIKGEKIWLECKSYQNRFDINKWEKTDQGRMCRSRPYKGYLLLEDLSQPKVSYELYFYGTEYVYKRNILEDIHHFNNLHSIAKYMNELS